MKLKRSFINVSLTAMTHNGKLRLYDAAGLPLSKWFKSSLCAPISSEVLNQIAWQERMKTLAYKASQRVCIQNADPWSRRAESFACSFKLRKRQLLRWKGAKRQQDKYSTTNWREAVSRLATQGKNASRRHDQTGWVLWAHTVSNNNEKRAKDIYEKRKLRDGKKTSGTTQSTELYLPSQRSHVDT